MKLIREGIKTHRNIVFLMRGRRHHENMFEPSENIVFMRGRHHQKNMFNPHEIWFS